jgi:hypothetical protein
VQAASGAIESKSATRCSGRDAVAARRVVAGDVEADRLSPRRQHLLVEHPVALVGRERRGDEVAVGQRRQDADDGELGALLPRRGADDRELVEQLALDPAPLVAGSGRGGRFSSRFQRPSSDWNSSAPIASSTVRPASAGFQVVPDQVELHLEAGHGLVTREGVLPQHHREGVQAPLHLRAVALTITPTERGPVDVLAHLPTQPPRTPPPGGRGHPGGWSTVTHGYHGR